MTNRERFKFALERKKLDGQIPTFELVYFLTMEKFGKVHPLHRNYEQWNQMSKIEQKLHIKDMAKLYVDIAEMYDHSCIFVHFNPQTMDVMTAILEEIRNTSNDKYFTIMHGDVTVGIPNGNDMMDFATRMYENPKSILNEEENNLKHMTIVAEKLQKNKGLLDGFALCSDYAFNANPFFSRDMFANFIAPYLQKEIQTYRDLGFYTIKHTDGNINLILDMIVDCKPDAIHSIDPQGHMNLENVRRLYGNKVATIGNVNCGLLQTGTLEEASKDIRRCISEGTADGGAGFIFSTSNCIYTGMPIERYELMNKIWKKEGFYKKQ